MRVRDIFIIVNKLSLLTIEEEAEILDSRPLRSLKCSDTGDWPEAEFSFPCDIFCFEGSYVAAVARNQAVISEEKVFSFWNSKAKVGVVVDINCEGLSF